jgi:hypothetical protein
MTPAERQTVIDALRFAEDVIDTDNYSLTLIYAALAIMRREREPLTDEQIDALWRAPMSADWEHREFARAIESAHGIGKD